MEKVVQVNFLVVVVLGSEVGGVLYGLQVLEYCQVNQMQNIMCFFVLVCKVVNVFDQVLVKIMLLMVIGQQVGVLVEVLLVLCNYNLIMIKLEFCLIYGNFWEEMFYFDIQVNLDLLFMCKVLKELVDIICFMKVFGCYFSENVVLVDLV